MKQEGLFRQKLKVINIGLSSFKDALDSLKVHSVQVDFRPGIEVNEKASKTLKAQQDKIEQANQEVIKIISEAKPALIGMGKALDLIPGMKKNLILHAGPPVTWERMCGPMRGAVIGALIYEDLAISTEEAEKLASGPQIEYTPCHEHDSVGPMAGIISASMPVFVVENEEFGNRAYATMNEGLGKVLRYGAFDQEVIKRLKWMEGVLYPTLQSAIKAAGKIDLKNIIAQALHMGDEVHNRNRAATSLFYRNLAPSIITSAKNSETAAATLNFINGNDHFFLNLSMAAAKASLDAAKNVKNSSIVVVMARNGTDFGIRLAGLDAWFTGPSPVPDALFFPGYTKEDANPDIGDSAITEALGLGGFAIAASPAIVQFVGGKAEDALAYTMQMYEITTGESSIYKIPYLDFRGVPTGIDVTKVIEKNILPFIDTGVAHKKAGLGQVGAGVLSAPIEPFQEAFQGLADHLKRS